MTYLRNILFLSMAALITLSVAQSAEVGQKLSACPLTEFSNNNSAVELNNYKGKVIYLDFWASWCPPCAKSFPFLNELHRQYHNEGLRIVAINLDEAPEDADKFLIQYPAEFTLARDLSKQCAEDLGVAAMPSSYLIDRKGIIWHIHLGFRASETQELREKVKQLLAEPIL